MTGTTPQVDIADVLFELFDAMTRSVTITVSELNNNTTAEGEE
ncbi:hypothetical protein [Bifidobacterium colobi]|nr:hypothetical protein [Bifidobacterium colobi]